MNRSVSGIISVVMITAVLLAIVGILVGCGGFDSGFKPLPSDFLLSSPTDSSTGVGTTPMLTWTDTSGETQYRVQIDVAPSFDTSMFYQYPVDANMTSFTVPASILKASTKYFWRVQAVNDSGLTTASNAPFSFTTTL